MTEGQRKFWKMIHEVTPKGVYVPPSLRHVYGEKPIKDKMSVRMSMRALMGKIWRCQGQKLKGFK